MVHPTLMKAVPVPMHNRDLKTGTLNGILRSTGITREELAELL
jgi:predicted RNA binding protein YcfA (HicA-like mRNA interferase family)